MGQGGREVCERPGKPAIRSLRNLPPPAPRPPPPTKGLAGDEGVKAKLNTRAYGSNEKSDGLSACKF